LIIEILKNNWRAREDSNS